MRTPLCQAGASGSSRSRFSARATSSAMPWQMSTENPTGWPARLRNENGTAPSRTPMRMVPRSLIAFSVPVSSRVVLRRGRAAAAASSSRASERRLRDHAGTRRAHRSMSSIMATSSLVHDQLALPLGDHRRGQRVADDVGGRAAHVEEGVDAQDQQQSFLRQAELADSVAAITTSEARGTPATPLLVSISVSSIAIWVPIESGMS